MAVDPHGWATRRRQSVRRAALGRGADPHAPRIAAVLLDIGGVIIPQLFESVRRPGFPRGPFGGDERYRAVQRGDLSERDYWAEVAAEVGVDVGALWREHTTCARTCIAPSARWPAACASSPSPTT